MIKKNKIFEMIRMISVFCIFALNSTAQNKLFIPDTISGGNYNLTAAFGEKEFFPGKMTPTYGFNGNFLGPTLIMKQNDFININVSNELTFPTTVHWHGFHISPENDGGPHQIIEPGTTWNPKFKMLNEASTFWYHPHGEGKTEIHISKGLAGMIIVRDDIESKLELPRSYGKDDFPLIVQSKAFDVFQQFATATHEDSVMMVNGTIDPYLEVPKQVVRLRLLNASADRTFNFGLSDNSDFYLIASDGGLFTQPYTTKRVSLSTGERIEILIDFSKYTLGDSIFLKSYSSELPNGIIGADSVGTSEMPMGEGYFNNPLNGADFNILKFVSINALQNPITKIPSTLKNRVALNPLFTDATREIVFEPDTVTSGLEGMVDGPFFMNGESFHMDSVNYTTYLGNTEIWTLINKTLVAHPFHIHDIQFFVVDINGIPPPPEYRGLKDVILVRPNDTLRFITKFETFADSKVPYMYHCHLLHHEDEGMMGAFLVLDTSKVGIERLEIKKNNLSVFPNPSNGKVQVRIGENQEGDLFIYNSLGQLLQTPVFIGKNEEITLNVKDWENGLYILKWNNSKIKLLVNR